MPVTFFASFYLTSATHITNNNRKCVAYKRNEERCGNQIQDLSRIHELHNELRDKDGKQIEEESRKNVLAQIAGYCLCHRHNENIYKQAAVRQWSDDIQSRANNRLLDEPKTPPKTSGGCLRLEFESYSDQNVDEDAIRQFNREIDLKIHGKLVREIENDASKSNYLYLFGHKAAKGVYKVGHTNYLRRIASDHEKCYPGLVIYCLMYCPNAILFEKVVHAEFGRYRRRHRCEKCEVKHGEWFQAPVEEIVHCITAWSLFARMIYRGDTLLKIADMHLPFPGVSSDPVRWRHWAMHWAELWRKKTVDSQYDGPDQSAVEQNIGLERDSGLDQHLELPSSPPPELSPSSAPGTPDDSLIDPPTPTPSNRRLGERYSSLQPMSILQASPTASTDSFCSSTTLVGNDSGLTPTEYAGTESGDIFWSPPPAKDSSDSTVGGHTPRASVYELGPEMFSTPTVAAGDRKGARKKPILVNFAGVTGQIDLSQEATNKLDPLELADMLRGIIFT